MSHLFDGFYCRKQRKLAKIWRAIARRHLSLSRCASCVYHRSGGDQTLSCGGDIFHESDGESDP
jgi:hypothetical protein